MKNLLKKKIIVFSITFLCSIVLCGCTNSLNFKYAYDKGMQAYNEKNYEIAITEFNTALNYKPESYSTLCLLATSYAYNRDEKMAERTFQDAIRLFPDDWNAYILYGDLKRSQHDYPSAIDFYETAITLGSMGGKEKAYYKKVLKELTIEEAAYDQNNSFSTDVAKDKFKDNVNNNSKRKLLEKQKNKKNIPSGEVLLGLDTKIWEKVLVQKDEKTKLIEYGIKGEDVQNYNWSQLVTIQYFAFTDNSKQQLSEYFKNHIGAVESVARNSSKTFDKKIITETSDEIFYEWKFDGGKESELARIVYTPYGIYHIHFAKKGAFSDSEKSNYTKLLKNAVLK